MRLQMKHLLYSLMITMLITGSSHATDWGLWYGTGKGKPPRGEDSYQTLANYGTYFMGNPNEKIIYLTFDCGYENGYTSKILDILQDQHVPATFFLVNDYLENNLTLVKRMIAEGHLLGNHTAQHPNMTKLTNRQFEKQLTELAKTYTKQTNNTLAPFYRPPEGAYNYENLKWAQTLGYHTILWSVAYADWDPDKQPSIENATKILNDRIHPGAIVLLHIVSSTNANILEKLIQDWKAQGYTFDYLSALPELPYQTKTAIPSNNQFTFQGKSISLTAFLIDNHNYIRLRDLNILLANTTAAFTFTYDQKTKSISLYPKTPKEISKSVTIELNQIATMPAIPGDQLKWNDQPLAINTFSIANENYISLREIADILRLEISYQSQTNIVSLAIPKRVM